MFTIAWHNLTHERGRFAVSVGGVAFAVVLVLIVSGLYQGWNERLTQYIQSVRADFWVAQRGSGDLSHSVSLLRNDLEDTLKSVEGVATVDRFIGRRIAFDLAAKQDVHIYVVGFDPSTGENGPIEMVEGSASPREREVIIDRAFAKQNNLKLGDMLELKKGESWEIIGIATGGNQAAYTYAFVNLDEVKRLLDMEAFTNYFIVTIDPGVDATTVKSRIEAAADVEAMPRADFIDENQKLIRETFLPIISVLLVIGFVIGAAVIGLTIYTATIEKASEYGVLKALGFSRSRLFRIVLLQSLISAIFGYGLGVGLAIAIASIAASVQPSFVTSFDATMFAGVFAMSLVMATVAAWAPTHRIASIDPADVFRA